MAKETIEITFEDGTTIEAEPTKQGTFAVHPPLGSTKKKDDWVVTHLPTKTVVLRTRLKPDATSAAKSFEWVFNLLTPVLVRDIVLELQAAIEY